MVRERSRVQSSLAAPFFPNEAFRIFCPPAFPRANRAVSPTAHRSDHRVGPRLPVRGFLRIASGSPRNRVRRHGRDSCSAIPTSTEIAMRCCGHTRLQVRLSAAHCSVFPDLCSDWQEPRVAGCEVCPAVRIPRAVPLKDPRHDEALPRRRRAFRHYRCC